MRTPHSRFAVRPLVRLGIALGLLGSAGCTGAQDEPVALEQRLASEDGRTGARAENAVSIISQIQSISARDGVRILDVTANGTGCPPGPNGQSVWAADISPDGQALTVRFSQYYAMVDSTTPLFVSKDCTLGITVSVPSGFTYAVSSSDSGGYVFLDTAGMKATQRVEYYFQGDQVRSPRDDTVMWGPQDEDYVLHDEVATASRVWAPCGASRTLNVKTGLTLMNNATKAGHGFIQMSSMANLVLTWKVC